jgi:nucleoside diphosphate kinase
MDNDFVVVLIKTDAPKRGLVPEILECFEREGLSVSEIGTVRFDLEFVKEFYQWPEIEHPKEMGEYMCVTPLPVLIVKGVDAFGRVTTIKQRLRAKYYNSPMQNLLHGSSSAEDAQREYDLLTARLRVSEKRSGPNLV